MNPSSNATSHTQELTQELYSQMVLEQKPAAEKMVKDVWDALNEEVLDIASLHTKCHEVYRAIGTEADIIRQWFHDNFRLPPCSLADAKRLHHGDLLDVSKEFLGFRKACELQTDETQEQRATRIKDKGSCVKEIVLNILDGERSELGNDSAGSSELCSRCSQSIAKSDSSGILPSTDQ
jgi:hypothetical protein